MTNKKITLALTSGEPAGIGIDLCVQLANAPWAFAHDEVTVVILGDADAFAKRAHALKLPFAIPLYPAAGRIQFLHVAAPATVLAGKLNVKNSPYVLQLLDRALHGIGTGEFSGMVTAPVHKAVINEAGIAFTGHTEYLAEKSKTSHVVMMLVGGGLKVAIATTHLPLKEVSATLTRQLLETTLNILNHDLQHKFGVAKPRILVAGLNPHAGEGGYLGREEIEVIAPVLDRLKKKMDVVGPLPADTLFTPKILKGSDAQLAMYHDQGLAVLKFASFGEGVNVTLGLPFIRTSVDHGTALDLAGTGKADGGSLKAALALAMDMARR